MAKPAIFNDVPQPLVAVIVRCAFNCSGATPDARLALSLVCRCALRLSSRARLSR